MSQVFLFNLIWKIENIGKILENIEKIKELLIVVSILIIAFAIALQFLYNAKYILNYIPVFYKYL